MSNKLEVMKSVLNKLQDIENSQESIIQKISQVEVDLFNIQSPDLDKAMGNVHSRAADTLDMMKEAAEAFQNKHDALAKEG